jgi:hypothetical protein
MLGPLNIEKKELFLADINFLVQQPLLCYDDLVDPQACTLCRRHIQKINKEGMTDHPVLV